MFKPSKLLKRISVVLLVLVLLGGFSILSFASTFRFTNSASSPSKLGFFSGISNVDLALGAIGLGPDGVRYALIPSSSVNDLLVAGYALPDMPQGGTLTVQFNGWSGTLSQRSLSVVTVPDFTVDAVNFSQELVSNFASGITYTFQLPANSRYLLLSCLFTAGSARALYLPYSMIFTYRTGSDDIIDALNPPTSPTSPPVSINPSAPVTVTGIPAPSTDKDLVEGLGQGMRAATEIITWLAIESKLYYALLLVGGLGAAVVIWRYVFQEI